MTLDDVVTEISARSAYFLTDAADCASPDAVDSHGAIFLTDVRSNVIEAFTGNDAAHLDHIDDWEDVIREIADGAPSVYTHTMWQQFVDLAAYQEDIDDYGEIESLDRAANLALIIIAERLAQALFHELLEAKAEDLADEDDEDGPGPYCEGCHDHHR